MEADWAKWVGRNRALKNADEEIDFQTDYVLDIARSKSWWMIVMIMWENDDYDFASCETSFLKASLISCAILKRDCGSDFPWNLDVGDMFKVLLLHPSTLYKILKKNFFARSGTITRTKTSSPTGTRALHPSSQVMNLTTNLLHLLFSYNSSPFPGTQSPVHHTNFMYALDDSLDTFMHQTKKWKSQQFGRKKIFWNILDLCFVHSIFRFVMRIGYKIKRRLFKNTFKGTCLLF